MRVFNKSNRLFQLEAGGEKMLVAPRKLIEVEEKFTHDLTYKTAVQAGDLEELTAAKVIADANIQEQIVDAATGKTEEAVQHPDGLDEVEAKRKADAATGKTSRRGQRKE
jgi:hypothetical protein